MGYPGDTASASGGRMWNDVMAAILNLWRHIKIRLRQPMHIYWKNNPAKFYPSPIWNGGALGFFWRGSPQQEQDE